MKFEEVRKEIERGCKDCLLPKSKVIGKYAQRVKIEMAETTNVGTNSVVIVKNKFHVISKIDEGVIELFNEDSHNKIFWFRKDSILRVILGYKNVLFTDSPPHPAGTFDTSLNENVYSFPDSKTEIKSEGDYLSQEQNDNMHDNLGLYFIITVGEIEKVTRGKRKSKKRLTINSFTSDAVVKLLKERKIVIKRNSDHFAFKKESTNIYAIREYTRGLKGTNILLNKNHENMTIITSIKNLCDRLEKADELFSEIKRRKSSIKEVGKTIKPLLSKYNKLREEQGRLERKIKKEKQRFYERGYPKDVLDNFEL